VCTKATESYNAQNAIQIAAKLFSAMGQVLAAEKEQAVDFVDKVGFLG
jgi:hypothetical protein